jgi:hypothetical protein
MWIFEPEEFSLKASEHDRRSNYDQHREAGDQAGLLSRRRI